MGGVVHFFNNKYNKMAGFLRKSLKTLINSPFSKRHFATGYGKSADSANSLFDDDPTMASGKTVVTILNQEQEDVIFMDAYSNIGFRMNNGMRLMGPCAVFPRSVLHWNIRGVEDINENSLSLFAALEPKLDILVLGVGDRNAMRNVDFRIIKFLKSKGINVEILPTDQALSTFNFLNSERRYVAGAFIPPNYIEELGDSEKYHSATGVAATLRDAEATTTEDYFFQEKEGDRLSYDYVDQNKELLKESVKKMRQDLRIRFGTGAHSDELNDDSEENEKIRSEVLSKEIKEILDQEKKSEEKEKKT